jgi:hypothetical protein
MHRMYRIFLFFAVTSSFALSSAGTDQPTVILDGPLLHNFVTFTLVFTNSDAAVLFVVFERLSIKIILFFSHDP